MLQDRFRDGQRLETTHIEANLGLWKRASDFSAADRLLVARLREHVTEAESDEFLLWILQVAQNPQLAREEAALQRRMGRIPKDRRPLLEIHDKQGFDDELVAQHLRALLERPSEPAEREATYDAGKWHWERPGILGVPSERWYKQFGGWILRSAGWVAVFLLVRSLLRWL